MCDRGWMNTSIKVKVTMFHFISNAQVTWGSLVLCIIPPQTCTILSIWNSIFINQPIIELPFKNKYWPTDESQTPPFGARCKQKGIQDMISSLLQKPRNPYAEVQNLIPTSLQFHSVSDVRHQLLSLVNFSTSATVGQWWIILVVVVSIRAIRNDWRRLAVGQRWRRRWSHGNISWFHCDLCWVAN